MPTVHLLSRLSQAAVGPMDSHSTIASLSASLVAIALLTSRGGNFSIHRSHQVYINLQFVKRRLSHASAIGDTSSPQSLHPKILLTCI